MSGTLPTTQKPASATLTSVQPTRVSVSHSLKRQARSSNAQRWALSFSWPPMARAAFMQLYSFLLAQRGQTDTFTCTLPGYTAPLGSWLGTPAVNGASQTGTTVALSGFTASQIGVAKAGDLLSFAGHSKVYMVTADADSNGAGQVSLSVQPALVVSPANGALVTVRNVAFTVAMTADNLDMALSPGLLTPLSVSMIEVY